MATRPKGPAKRTIRTFHQVKAERTNRAENTNLQRRLHLMDNQCGQLRTRVLREKREITQRMSEMRRTTGNSALRVKPNDNDFSKLKQSPYFSTGRGLSEKGLTKWRYAEYEVERRFKIAELESRRQRQYEESLISLLKDLGIIPKDADILKRSQTKLPTSVKKKGEVDEEELYKEESSEEEDDADKPLWDRFPKVFKSLLPDKPPSPNTIRQALLEGYKTADEFASSTENIYAERVTSLSPEPQKMRQDVTINPPAFMLEPRRSLVKTLRPRASSAVSKLPIDSAIVEERSEAHVEDEPQTKGRQIESAPPRRKSSIIFDQLQQKAQMVSSGGGASSSQPQVLETRHLHPDRDLVVIEDPEDHEALAELAASLRPSAGTGAYASTSQPQWRRQLLAENPIGLSGTREQVRVRLTISRAERRRQLSQMVTDNKKDLEKLAFEEKMRRTKYRDSMAQAMRDIASLDPQN